MRIVEETGDMFASESEILVNTVNCVGVMGKGLALKFAKIFPSMVPDYKRACQTGEIRIGKCQIWEVPDACKGNLDYNFYNLKYVVNFPTKNHWRYASHKEYIRQGLVSLAADLGCLALNQNYSNSKNSLPRTIAFPALGCSLGGLDWNDTRSLILELLEYNFFGFEEIKLFGPYK
jgi:O-acetyl-ADP-ribose deacetylase (regulator of RNase III)